MTPTERRPGIAYRRPDGDPSRLVIEADGAARIDVEECPESGWLDVVADADRDRLRDALDEPPVDVAYRVVVTEEPQWVRERGRETGDGAVVGYLLPADERVERRRELERQRERLSEFASVVSHDLRNPLSVAVGNLRLARELDGAAATERLDRVEDALDRMDDLIADVLALARNGQAVKETEPTDLRMVVDRAWQTAGEATAAELVVDGPLPTVACDSGRVRQAFENLFRNAVEHAATDGESGSAGAEATDGESGRGDDIAPGTFRPDESPDDPAVRVFVGRGDDGFYVADDGPGIDPELRDEVFEPGRTTAADGTGFGLAIVERIAEAHDWTVSVTESRVGGARFEFTGVEPVGPVADGDTDPS